MADVIFICILFGIYGLYLVGVKQVGFCSGSYGSRAGCIQSWISHTGNCSTLVDEIYGLSVPFSVVPVGYSNLHSSSVLGSEINPDKIHQPIIVPALDPNDSLDRNHNDNSLSLPPLLKNTPPQSESDINPDDIRPPIVVSAPDPDDSSGPIPSNNTLSGLERDINPDDIRPPILLPAPDPGDSAEGHFPKDTPAELESSINPDDIQPPIIVLVPDSDDKANDFHDRLPEISLSLSASLSPQGAELDVQIEHGVRDPFSPTPHLPHPWEAASIPYPHDEDYIFSPTPQLPRPWERPDEMFQAIRSSPPPQLMEVGQRITPSPHVSLPTPSFFLYEASSRASSRASSVRNSIIEQSPASLAAFEYNAFDAHVVPLPASREPSIADSVRSLSGDTPLHGVKGHSTKDVEMRLFSGAENVSHGASKPKSSYAGNDISKQVSGPTEQTINQPLPSREMAQ